MPGAFVFLLAALAVGVQARPQGTLRLRDGPLPTMGRLEMYVNDGWSTVCDNYLRNDNNGYAARVACRKLGFSDADAHWCYTSAAVDTDDDDSDRVPCFPGGTGLIAVSHISCEGDEDSLLDCEITTDGDNECMHAEDASLVCSGDALPEDGDVRLVNGPTPQAGRLEVYHDSAWGMVCDNGWDGNKDNARVVCTQLGYKTDEARTCSASNDYEDGNCFGAGIYGAPQWLYGIECRGNETNVVDCPRSGWGDECDYEDAVSIICGDPVSAAASIAPSLAALLAVALALAFGL
jgi:hypothetical protein